MDNYRKVKQPKAHPEKTSPNEIRIQASGKISYYVRSAIDLLTAEQKGESEGKFVTIKALGKAINRAITVAEILKSHVQDLHQVTSISSTDITDVYEPLVEGLQRLETTRQVSDLEIFLGTSLPTHMDKSHFGYQPPLSPEEFEALVAMKKDIRGKNDRNQSHKSQNDQALEEEEEGDEDGEDNGYGEEEGADNEEYNEQRPAGRGRSFRGRRGRRPGQQSEGPEGEADSNETSGSRRRGRGRGGRGRGRGRSRGRAGNRNGGYLNDLSGQAENELPAY